MFLEVAEEAVFEVLFVGLVAAVDIGLAEFEQAVNHAGELVGRGGVGLGGAESGLEAAIERAEGRLAAPDGLGGEAQGGGGAVDDAPGARLVSFAAGDFDARAKAQPGGKVLFGFPFADVTAQFAEEGLRGGGLDAGDAGQIDAEQAVEFAAQIADRLVARGLFWGGSGVRSRILIMPPGLVSL